MENVVLGLRGFGPVSVTDVQTRRVRYSPQRIVPISLPLCDAMVTLLGLFSLKSQVRA